LASCTTTQSGNKLQTTSSIIKYNSSLKIGDKIELFEGYDDDPLYLRNPPADKRTGTVIQFIPGQGKPPAGVVKLDQK